MKDNYIKMTVEQLEAENQNLMQKKAELREEQKRLVQVLDAKRAEAALAEDMQSLEEKHGATLQVVKAKGIESAEGVNGE